MNNYKHEMIELQALYTAVYGNAARVYQTTPDDYQRGFMDGVDFCLGLLTSSIIMCDKEE